jgi:hypothetical protein
MGFDSVPLLPMNYLNWIFELSSTDLEIFLIAILLIYW